ncbi:MAG: VWA domain-containing protein [Planctomycetota bacterium]
MMLLNHGNSHLGPMARCAALCGAILAVAGTGGLQAGSLTLDVSPSHPVLLSGQKQTTYVRISLTGSEIESDEERPPLNVAVVIDTSGSMSGDKIVQARKAAIEAVKRLRSDDIVSVVLYDSDVEVLVPATKATDRDSILAKIQSIQANGSTALFAGVSKGAAEVRKFIGEESVNRVILLSDGRANRGPSTPSELARLGASLVKEGISVSTLGLGLGYNEDLMSDLALAGSGNHLFIEEADDLVAMFNAEFNDLMSVVAGDFEINVRVAKGVRPVRVLGTDADIDGQNVFVPLTQLYSRQQRYFVMELEVPSRDDNESMKLADVDIAYVNKITNQSESARSTVSVQFSSDEDKIAQNRNLEVIAYCTVQIANERNRRATLLRDAGKVEEAKKLLLINQSSLSTVRRQCIAAGVDSVLPELNFNCTLNEQQAVGLEDDSKWSSNRKLMRAAQNYNQVQQRSAPKLKVPDLVLPSLDSKP